MKFLITLLCLSSTIFAHSFDRENTFFYEPALAVQVSNVSGYKLADVNSGRSVGGSIRAGYHYNISDDFYIEPIINLNLMTENKSTGQNPSNLQTVDILTTTNLYGLMFRIGTIRYQKKYGFELVLGLESNTYSVDQDFANFVGGTKADDITSTNFIYGIRFIGNQSKTLFFDQVKFGIELLTQSTSFNPIKNINETWDVQTTTLSFFYFL
ncbi:MAG: autotransporter outer membrane beta-barrel domain-containing protein [Candidatus Margulisiibacteriota bacterium]